MDILVSLVGAMLVSSIYFLPSMLAISRRHINALPVFLTNLYLGWTVFGWIGALIWGLSRSAVPEDAAAYSGRPAAPAAVSTGGSKKYLAYGLAGLGVVIIVLALIVALSPQSPPRPAPMTVKSGVPVPIDEMFGKPKAAK